MSIQRVDTGLINVLADTAPTVTLPDNYTVIEGGRASITATTNSGRPAANRISYAFYSSLANAQSETNPFSGGSAITATITPALTSSEVTDTEITITFTSPYIGSATAVEEFIYLRVDLAITGQSDAARNMSGHDIMAIRVVNALTASVSIAATFTHYEVTAVNIPFTFWHGSPVATEFRHSFHPTPTDATNDTNEYTTNVPTATFTHTSFEDLQERAIVVTESGTINYTTPAVTADTTYYARLEIIQNGVVAGFATYSILVENSIDPSIVSVGNLAVVEGGLTRTLYFTYTSGAPYADLFVVTLHSTRDDATNGVNALTTDVPTIQWSYAPRNGVPNQSAGTHNGHVNLRYIPYVDADRTIYIRLEIRQGSSVWYRVAELLIYNRVLSTIDMPEVINVPERGTLTVTGTYQTGIPTGQALGYRVYPTETDAENSTNELTGENQPLTIVMNPTRPAIGGHPNTIRTVSATITAPEVSRNEDFGIRWYITQNEITPDPA